MIGKLSVGDPIFVDSIDGFSGLAYVTAAQVNDSNNDYSRYQIQMCDKNPAKPFWTQDFELSYPPDSVLLEISKHIDAVRKNISCVIKDLQKRALLHDRLSLTYKHGEEVSNNDYDFPNKVSLLSLIEMLCDLKSQTLVLRDNNCDINELLEINQKRFGYSDELKQILLNTLPVID